MFGLQEIAKVFPKNREPSNSVARTGQNIEFCLPLLVLENGLYSSGLSTFPPLDPAFGSDESLIFALHPTKLVGDTRLHDC